ncbi:MAG: alginate lyase family protein [Pirellulales bacterium]
MKNIARLIRTIRTLKPSQLAWRLRYRLFRPLEESRWSDVARRTHSIAEGVAARQNRATTPCDLRADNTAMQLLVELKQGNLTLLNSQRPFRGGIDWCMTGGRQDDRLWKYTLHYHGWLVQLAHGFATTGDDGFAKQLATKLDDWLCRCPLGDPGFSHYAWNSYTIATRLDYWRQLLNILPPAFWNTRKILQRDFFSNMAAQATYLSRHLEWDLRGNHLFRDALGLATAARLFEGVEPQRWMNQAERIVASQLDEQILPDGGHFERSAAYHLDVIRDLIKLAALVGDQILASRLRETCVQMAETAAWLRHPDGYVVQRNDGACSDANETLATCQLIGLETDMHRRVGGRWFKSTGLVVWHGNPWSVFFQVGEIGPAIQPGHAHADSLTMECSYDGKRLFVDPGCHSYDDDGRRKYDRSTVAHNTVCIDQTDSSEVWHIFRVGRRARPMDTNVEIHDHAIAATAAHTGYDQLRGGPRHRRHLVVCDDGPLEIVDEIEGNGSHHIEAGFLLDPRWTAETKPGGWRLQSDNTSLHVELDGSEQVELDVRPALIHPDYGVEMETQRLVWRYRGKLPLKVCSKISNVRTQTSSPSIFAPINYRHAARVRDSAF